MSDEYAKIKSVLDDENGDENAENDYAMLALSKASAPGKGSLASRLFDSGTKSLSNAAGAVTGSAANFGTRVLAGGLAAAQTMSATSLVTILCAVFGISFATGDGYDITYRDDYLPDNPYVCLDEFAEAYRGVFGTINETSMAEQHNTIVKRLKEINEWSKTYVGQSVPDRLVCDEADCPFYGHEGCPDGSHSVKKVTNGTYTYYDQGGQIDLANLRRIHSFFSAYGLTDVQIAAMCGVMTIESRIDFTSVEGYNIQGDRYNLDPSQTVTVDGETYGFKPWAEGLDGSPIQTPTCIHEIAANQGSYSGTDAPIDYAAYSSEYPAIQKLGIGLIGFTDGDGFWNNTYLRNFADYLNDKVLIIQNIVEGSRGWREELRQRAADTYHIAYGADPNADSKEDKRGTAEHYVEKVVDSEYLFYKDDHAGEQSTDFEEWDEREGKSSAWLYKEAADEYKKAEKELEEAVDAYMKKADEYDEKINELKNTSWMYHTVNTSDDPNGAPLKNIEFKNHDLDKDSKKITTKFQDDCDPNKHPVDQYVSICEIEKLKECDKSDEEEPYLEYENPTPGAEQRNNIDVLYPKIEMKDVWNESDKDPSVTQTVTVVCNHGSGPGHAFSPPGNAYDSEPVFNFNYPAPSPYDPPWAWDSYRAAYDAAYNSWQAQHAAWQQREQWRQEQTAADAAAVGAGGMPTAPTPPVVPSVPRPSGAAPRPSDYYNYSDYQSAYNAWLAAKNEWDNYDKAYQKYGVQMQQYSQNMGYFNSSGGSSFFTGSNPAADAEHEKIMALKAEVEAMVEELKKLYQDMMDKKEAYEKTLEKVNKWAKIHAHDVVKFYNALQDYYTASDFDMESKIRDASLTKTTIFDDAGFFTEAAYEYEFTNTITKEKGDSDKIKFKEVFDKLEDGSSSSDTETDSDDEKITAKKLRLYYELWQNYAKYATNLPKSGKYINWWTPEVQMLYMVGGSYDEEKGQGLKVRDEYLNANCGECSKPQEYDTDISKNLYEWMSTWKGENYTGCDITTATKNYYLDMVSGGFDDGTLKTRTEYAYAYYYMFQYDSPYQQSINYASVGGEASKIMDEMIAEGRWQTNASNTLSDTAMPHNDKWKEYQERLDYANKTDNIVTRQWDLDTSTTLSTSVLATLSAKQSHSRVNLLTDIWNGCRYINVIDNSTVSTSGLYLVDDPLIYKDSSDKFYKMRYGENPDPAPEAVSNLTRTVYTLINKRLQDNGKTQMSGSAENMTDFNFIKTNILWSGMDIEFENISDVDELKEYLKEATSSIWQTEEDYQTDSDDEKKIGRGNSKIWEQRRLGPYYDRDGNVYYRYKWVLVPRVLDDDEEIQTDYYKWYDDMRNDKDAERGFGDTTEDYDKYDEHEVGEHFTNNTPSTQETPGSAVPAQDKDGYKRKVNEDNNKLADWVRVDWECYDPECDECGGKGGHGDQSSLNQGDIIIGPDDKVYIWFGEAAVKSMFPLETDTTPPLVMAGGNEPTKLKSAADTGFEWSKPCSSYVDHETPCPEHCAMSNLPKTPEKHDDDACEPYNPDGKWTVYRLITPNYTDSYRSAGVMLDPLDDDEWETWYKYKYKGMSTYADDKKYLEEVRKEIGAVINTEFDRDKRY